MKKPRMILLCAAALALAGLACSLLTSPGTPSLRFSPDVLPDGRAGQPYRAVIALSGQRTPAFQMGTRDESLPPGLSGAFDRDAQTYTLSGTPSRAGTFSFAVTALCYGTNVSGQSGAKEYRLVIRR